MVQHTIHRIFGEQTARSRRSRKERESVALLQEDAQGPSLQQMIDEQGDVELTCRFCDNVQKFTKSELETMLEGMKKKVEKI